MEHEQSTFALAFKEILYIHDESLLKKIFFLIFIYVDYAILDILQYNLLYVCEEKVRIAWSDTRQIQVRV